MHGTRYEQYDTFVNNIPAKANINLKRDKFYSAFETNWHENLEIQLCKSGEGYVLLNGESVPVKKNSIVVVNSNVVHYTGSHSEMTYSCIIIDSKFCKNADIDVTALNFQNVFEDDELSDLFNNYINIYSEGYSACKTARMQAILLELLIVLREKHILAEKNKSDDDQFDTVKKTIRFIRDNYGKNLSLDQISENVYINKYSLSRQFKAVTGLTLIQYINNYRCQKAAELIQEGFSVSKAAEKCGFNNMSFFTKTFKLYKGKLPKEYKKR